VSAIIVSAREIKLVTLTYLEPSALEHEDSAATPELPGTEALQQRIKQWRANQER
jgi:hypothetical protein